MTTLREAAQQALKALEQCGLDDTHRSYEFEHAARAALRAALEQQEPEPGVCGRCGGLVYDPVVQQEQEPVAWRYRNANTDHVYLVWKKGTGGRNWTPLYTHPPRREWQSLSEEEITDCWTVNDPVLPLVGTITRAIEAALRSKNQ